MLSSVLMLLLLLGAGTVLAQSQGPELPADRINYKNMNDLLVEVGHRVPGFGGMRMASEDNVLYVYLLDQGDRMAAQQAIEEVFGRQRIPEGGVRVLQGEYSIAQLKQWYDTMYMSVLTIPGVTATDLPEGGNRLWIGVENMDLQWKVEEELGSLDIPREAVIIEKFQYFVEDSHTIQ